jgi:RimJ/RimL family protein N-acetyltransferase
MLTGRTVMLRPIEVEDLGFLRDLNNHPAIAGAVVGWDFPVSLHGQAEWLRHAETSTTRRLTVLDAESAEPVGLTGLWDIDWHNRSALSAIKLHPDRARRGMGTDSIMTLMAWAFGQVGLRRLYGAILDFNGPSIGSYVGKCGWRVEGLEREAIFRKGRFCDLYRVAALDRDFWALPLADEYVKRICPVDLENRVDVSRLQRGQNV